MTALLSETLVEIKRVIETYGWIQRVYGDRQKGFCLDGAIIEVCFGVERDNNDHLARYNEVRKFLYGLLGSTNAHVTLETLITLPTWNDKPLRTKQDVLDLLDRAIGVARERELTPVG